MKFDNQLQISIPEPCHQDWNNMTMASAGRHCESCRKIVVDFVNMSDDDILAYLQRPIVNICGRITQTQLNKYSTRFPNIIKIFLYSFTMVFLVGASDVVIAQTQNPKDSLYVINSSEIYGNVKDEKGRNLDFSNITVYQGGVLKGGTKSDIHGNYKMKGLSEGKYDLKVSHIGYKQDTIKNIIITENRPCYIDIILEKRLETKQNIDIIIGEFRYNIITPTNPNSKIITNEQIEHFPY